MPTPHSPHQQKASSLNSSVEKQLVELQAVHEAFVRAISHDLRAPLRHLTSFAPLLREAVEALAQTDQGSDSAQDALEFVGVMEVAARKMGAMLDGVLQVSRASRQPLNIKRVDAAQVMKDCATQLATMDNGLHWELPNQVVWVQADPQALHAVLHAVMGNAMKFTSQQAQPILQIHVSQPEAETWQFAIRDNGAGCDSTRLSLAWPPFQRLHREQEFSGVGCGLAQAYAWVSRHGGSLSLQSQPGAGCTAIVIWPAAPVVV